MERPFVSLLWGRECATVKTGDTWGGAIRPGHICDLEGYVILRGSNNQARIRLAPRAGLDRGPMTACYLHPGGR